MITRAAKPFPLAWAVVASLSQGSLVGCLPGEQGAQGPPAETPVMTAVVPDGAGGGNETPGRVHRVPGLGPAPQMPTANPVSIDEPGEGRGSTSETGLPQTAPSGVAEGRGTPADGGPPDGGPDGANSVDTATTPDTSGWVSTALPVPTEMACRPGSALDDGPTQLPWCGDVRYSVVSYGRGDEVIEVLVTSTNKVAAMTSLTPLEKRQVRSRADVSAWARRVVACVRQHTCDEKPTSVGVGLCVALCSFDPG